MKGTMTNRAGIGRALALVSLLTMMACARPADVVPTSLTIDVAGRASASPSLAADGERVVLAWAASSDVEGTDVFASMSHDGGATFGPPVRVNATPGQASINTESPPRVALVRGAGGASQVVVVWGARGDTGTILLSSTSADDGRTFGPSALVPGSDGAGNRGWESVAVGQDGGVRVVWLDHRDGARPAGEPMHQHGADTSADPVARAQRSQLFVGDVDGAVAAHGVARGVCYCCKTAALVDRMGTMHVAWRHVYDGSERDIAFASSRDGGRSFSPSVRVSDDGWQLDGCPENGPSLAAVGDRVHVVWPTLVRADGAETLRLFAASTLDGRTFTPRTPLPTTGAAYHPQVIPSSDGGLIAAWDEVDSGTPRRVRVAHGQVDADGVVRFTPIDLGGSDLGSHPVVASAPEHLIVAWTTRATPSAIAVRRIPR